MAGYEQTIVIGNVGREPETRDMPSGNGSVTSFSVAVTTKWTDRQTQEKKERVTWYSVSCWNRLSDIAKQYVRKGTQIMVVGTVTARAYMDKNNQPQASLDLRAENFQLLGGRGDNMSGGSGSDADYGGDAGYAPRDMDDIPF
jgi:single-strand DNA-binding protein